MDELTTLLESREKLQSLACSLNAGDGSLLVSHWPVVSDAAVALTTRMLAATKTGLTRAKTHRQAMMAMIDTGPAQNSHPALWAPFVVVGEGGK